MGSWRRISWVRTLRVRALRGEQPPPAAAHLVTNFMLQRSQHDRLFFRPTLTARKSLPLSAPIRVIPEQTASPTPLARARATLPGIVLSALVAGVAVAAAPLIGRLVPVPAMVIALIIGIALNPL